MIKGKIYAPQEKLHLAYISVKAIAHLRCKIQPDGIYFEGDNANLVMMAELKRSLEACIFRYEIFEGGDPYIS